MAGKVREDAHKPRAKGDEAQEVPRVSLDYCFLGRVLDLGESADPRAQDLQEPQGKTKVMSQSWLSLTKGLDVFLQVLLQKVPIHMPSMWW